VRASPSAPGLVALALALVVVATSGRSHARRLGAGRGRDSARVVLDGREVAARWNDGDTFKPRGAAHPLRVTGYNTLETYGAVHRWGAWDPAALEALAHRATEVAASQTRTCTSVDKSDVYGRGLVSCPDAAAALVGEGLAMVYAVEPEVPDAKLLAIQTAAQKAGRGLWAKGVPDLIVTSVHSADEPPPANARPGRPHRAHNRVVDPRTGRTTERAHDKVYATCQEVCETEGRSKSCLVYVPFERRYKNRPPCLQPRPALAP
jgi:micrococcal nuclease